ncbi:hypothetical protein PYCC9005_002214 [Savitreella phatthalungensis]
MKFSRLNAFIQEKKLEASNEGRASYRAGTGRTDATSTASELSEIDEEVFKDIEELVCKSYKAHGTVLQTLNNDPILLQVVKGCEDAAAVLKVLKERYDVPQSRFYHEHEEE